MICLAPTTGHLQGSSAAPAASVPTPRSLACTVASPAQPQVHRPRPGVVPQAAPGAFDQKLAQQGRAAASDPATVIDGPRLALPRDQTRIGGNLLRAGADAGDRLQQVDRGLGLGDGVELGLGLGQQFDHLVVLDQGEVKQATPEFVGVPLDFIDFITRDRQAQTARSHWEGAIVWGFCPQSCNFSP